MTKFIFKNQVISSSKVIKLKSAAFAWEMFRSSTRTFFSPAESITSLSLSLSSQGSERATTDRQ